MDNMIYHLIGLTSVSIFLLVIGKLNWLKAASATTFVCLPFVFSTLLVWDMTLVHESEESKHRPLPQCHGWIVKELNRRVCPLDSEWDMCVDAIHHHGKWHISEPFKCEEELNGKEEEQQTEATGEGNPEPTFW